MSKAPDGVKLKISRAEEHLEALHREVQTYLDSTPYTVECKLQSGGNWQFFSKVHHQPSLRTSVLLGDFLHNLRSSLDHLAWQLVLIHGGTPTTHTTFPIFKKKSAYKKYKKNKDTVTGIVGEISALRTSSRYCRGFAAVQQ